MKKDKTEKTLIIIAVSASSIGLVVLLVFIGFLIYAYDLSSNINVPITQMVGTFIGCTVSTCFLASSIALIYLTYRTNREELKKLNEYNQMINEYNQMMSINHSFDKMLEAIEKIIENDSSKYSSIKDIKEQIQFTVNEYYQR